MAGGFFEVIKRVIDGDGDVGQVVAAIGEIGDFGGVGDFSQCELAWRKGFVVLWGDYAGLWFLAADGCKNQQDKNC